MPVGQFTGPGEVAALQKSVKAELEAIRTSLQRCATSGTFTPEKTPGEWTAWQAMKKKAEDFVTEAPSWFSTVSQFERGELVRKELASWVEKAKGFGCDAGPAPMLPAEKTPLFSLPGLTTTGLLLLLIVLALKK